MSKCSYCGGIDRTEGRHQCLSCGAPAENPELDGMLVRPGDVSGFEVRAERCMIEVTSHCDDQPRYIAGIRRYSPITLTVAPTEHALTQLRKLLK